MSGTASAPVRMPRTDEASGAGGRVGVSRPTRAPWLDGSVRQPVSGRGRPHLPHRGPDAAAAAAVPAARSGVVLLGAGTGRFPPRGAAPPGAYHEENRSAGGLLDRVATRGPRAVLHTGAPAPAPGGASADDHLTAVPLSPAVGSDAYAAAATPWSDLQEQQAVAPEKRRRGLHLALAGALVLAGGGGVLVGGAVRGDVATAMPAAVQAAFPEPGPASAVDPGPDMGSVASDGVPALERSLRAKAVPLPGAADEGSPVRTVAPAPAGTPTPTGTGAGGVLPVAGSRDVPVQTRVASKQYAASELARHGWSTQEQFGCLDRLWTRESGWNHLARNPSSGAYGIPQSLPATKLATAGSDWQTNPRTQISWGLAYIKERYGTPCAAWAHSEKTGWY